MVSRTERREKIIMDAYEERSAIGRAFEEKKRHIEIYYDDGSFETFEGCCFDRDEDFITLFVDDGKYGRAISIKISRIDHFVVYFEREEFSEE